MIETDKNHPIQPLILSVVQDYYYNAQMAFDFHTEDQSWMGICCFCNDAILRIDLINELFFCFTCYNMGDVILFIMRTENCKMYSVFEKIEERYGIKPIDFENVTAKAFLMAYVDTELRKKQDKADKDKKNESV